MKVTGWRGRGGHADQCRSLMGKPIIQMEKHGVSILHHIIHVNQHGWMKDHMWKYSVRSFRRHGGFALWELHQNAFLVRLDRERSWEIWRAEMKQGQFCSHTLTLVSGLTSSQEAVARPAQPPFPQLPSLPSSCTPCVFSSAMIRWLPPPLPHFFRKNLSRSGLQSGSVGFSSCIWVPACPDLPDFTCAVDWVMTSTPGHMLKSEL